MIRATILLLAALASTWISLKSPSPGWIQVDGKLIRVIDRRF